MDVPELEQILQDARLVINYAFRVGRLPDDSLLNAVARARNAPPEDGAKELPALVVALNNAVRAIAPMSLTQLRAGLSPFEPRGQRRLKTAQVFFSVLTILLGALVATFTEQLRREDLALKSFQQIQDAHFLDKLDTLRRKVKIDAILSQKDSIHFDEYHRSLSELRELQDRFNGAASALTTLAPGSWWQQFQPFKFILASFGVAPPRGTEAGGGSYGPKTDAPVPKTDAPVPKTDAPVDVCDPGARQAVGHLNNYDQWVQLVVADFLDGLCFETQLSVFVVVMPQRVLWDIQNRMAELNAWILPFLYGLLGASVYVMRDMLDPTTPTLGFAAALLRVSLGGIAGIIIGWFSAALGGRPAEAGGIALVPFSLAFVAGFSIDVLFSVLDRVQRTIRPVDDQSTPARVGPRS
jgi:hypothetical protein